LDDAVPYLHSFFSFETEEARWLAGKLGIRLQARPEEVARYLIIKFLGANVGLEFYKF